MSEPVLTVEALTVESRDGTTRRAILDGLSFALGQGEILGLVGESGSGKTMACRALMRLLTSPTLSISADAIRLGGRDISKLGETEFARIRGREMGMIFQNPSSHLDPVMRIGEQIAETVRVAKGASRREAKAEAVDILRQVGIPDPVARADAYAHEFSGGMRQRAMIAVALASDPKILIADEPTTALDVTVQAQVLRLLKELRDRRGMSLIFITHDLGVVAQLCDSIAVLYAGRLCEKGPVRQILRHPHHRYTAGLIACQPGGAAVLSRLRTIEGQPPSPTAMPPGCRFHPRCGNASNRCRSEQPQMMPFGPAESAACFHPVGDPAHLGVSA
ncbi:ABC transporter ATP-binding protein [Aureimonas sp. SA4125]|uniref:ABC transporter ATP-binding protein n=1 Tax=Aureimonas sp. SA4125 TaxID=2826993 RepID=UPI001CC599AA|nr:ABC transporter ATP-binding protein [Aureimonas sp. SA4125]BDA84374.1 ABC transporter ATP-binding protein [Aureimonas sp. SA4125]